MKRLVFRRLHFDDEEIKRQRMSQPGIANFTRRVTRRQTRQKTALLDADNSNLVTLGGKIAPASPLKKKLQPELLETSPAKIKKASKPLEQVYNCINEI